MAYIAKFRNLHGWLQPSELVQFNPEIYIQFVTGKARV